MMGTTHESIANIGQEILKRDPEVGKKLVEAYQGALTALEDAQKRGWDLTVTEEVESHNLTVYAMELVSPLLKQLEADGSLPALLGSYMSVGLEALLEEVLEWLNGELIEPLTAEAD